MNGKILTIRELNQYIKMKLENEERLQGVWIRGEISNFTHHSSGHMYFTLKDKDSRIRSIMFASYNRRLPFIPRDGALVIARGNVSVFERDGQYQFYAEEMQPDGLGSLYLAFEQLKQKLEAEGLFHFSHKKSIPKYPKTIGIITSPTGAAIKDILITLKRRCPMVSILVHPVMVQGKQAAVSIVKAIQTMNELSEADVLIVGRGGGSLEELWSFNEEIVARAIFCSKIPIISAVGHETDFTVADFVADVRAATPTAAAELAVIHQQEMKQQIHHCKERMTQSIRRIYGKYEDRFKQYLRSPFFMNPKKQLFIQPIEKCDRLTEKLCFLLKKRKQESQVCYTRLDYKMKQLHPENRLKAHKQKVSQYKTGLTSVINYRLHIKSHQFHSLVRQLDSLSPLKVMSRGYSLVYDEKQKEMIQSINQVQLGDVVHVRLKDGKLHCHVWSMEEIHNVKKQ